MTTTTLPRKTRRIPTRQRVITPTSLGEQFTYEGTTNTIWSDGPGPRSVWAIDETTGAARAFRMPDPKKGSDWLPLIDEPERTKGWKTVLAVAISGQSIYSVSHYTRETRDYAVRSYAPKKTTVTSTVIHASTCPLIPKESETVRSNGAAEGVLVGRTSALDMIAWLHHDKYGSAHVGAAISQRKIAAITEATHCACMAR